MGDYDCPSAATLVYNSDDLEPPLDCLSSFMSKKAGATAFSNDSHLSGVFRLQDLCPWVYTIKFVQKEHGTLYHPKMKVLHFDHRLPSKKGGDPPKMWVRDPTKKSLVDFLLTTVSCKASHLNRS